MFRQRLKNIAGILNTIESLPQDQHDELAAAVHTYNDSGNNTPVIDFLKKVFTDPATLKIAMQVLSMILMLFPK